MARAGVGAVEVVRGGRILDIYSIRRFADRLDVMSETEVGIKNDLKNFNLQKDGVAFNGDGKGRLPRELVGAGKT